MDEDLDTVDQHEPGFPINRVVAFLGPQISWVAGVIATWLITNVHILGIDHFGHDSAAKAIAEILTFTVVTVLTYVGQHKWLDGYSKWEQSLTAPTPTPVIVAAGVPTEAPDTVSAAEAGAEPLPVDEPEGAVAGKPGETVT